MSIDILYSELSIKHGYKVPYVDKERPYVIPLVRSLPIPHLQDWRKMEVEVCLINFNKGKDDEGCLKFCNGVQLCTEYYGRVV